MNQRIDVFLMFQDTDRNSMKFRGRKKIIDKGPDWSALGVEVKRHGYELNVMGPPSIPAVSEVKSSLATAEVTVFVGHGATTASGAQFVSTQLKLSDGIIDSGDGMYQGKWSGIQLEPEPGTAAAKPRLNRVTGLFTCNSAAKMADAFELPEGASLVTNDGGDDGLTRIGTLELAAFSFIRHYASSGGNTQRAMSHAQAIFKRKGRELLLDRGDRLHVVTGKAEPAAVPAR